ncbi:M20 aminoacylase family protein [Lutimaribacter saemankumensis]|uniref:Hippurate hydrolase n=1 Tax=Lutimaribacter saemankumensis TaxID=490829 RepID=A0A1G8GMT6_9RHOB|nr:M20 aminoacylase family protein [Lutimaribacter saemankumensis]SDH95616.1 hippurate hydrolase [Lutimaribacter saemankumensis]
MTVMPEIAAAEAELVDIFEDLHAHPEIGFEENRTAQIVAEKLRAYGVDEVHTGIGGTGVVGLIRGKGTGNRCVGLRADMDALPIDEATGLPYASQSAGKMHACGHDGHTTMLLGAARYLAETRNFDGTAMVVFQPAEEGLGGARRMLAEGLFERFPCDEIYGLHNNPMAAPGEVSLVKGAAMAGAQFFDITVRGQGSHAAMPHQSRDALVIASSLVGQIQTVVSRNVPATETCVVSVTQIHSGAAYNVVPAEARLAGTIRYFSDEMRDLAESRMADLCKGAALAYGVEIDFDSHNVFDVLLNDADLSDAYLDAAREVVGGDKVSERTTPLTGSEDFADMLKVVPGAYCMVGHSGDMPLHNPGFVLGKEILPVGASLLSRIVEKRLPLG